jgi:hypothetical protein
VRRIVLVATRSLHGRTADEGSMRMGGMQIRTLTPRRRCINIRTAARSLDHNGAAKPCEARLITARRPAVLLGGRAEATLTVLDAELGDLRSGVTTRASTLMPMSDCEGCLRWVVVLSSATLQWAFQRGAEARPGRA